MTPTAASAEVLRASVEALSHCTHHAGVDESGLDRVYAILRANHSASGLDGHLLPALDARDRISFVLARDAINFGSGFHDVVRKLEGHSGSRTMSARLAAHFASEGPLSARTMATASPQMCARLFGQDVEGPAAELMRMFACSWRRFGEILLERYDGSADALVEAAGGSSIRLVALLSEMPHWDDISRQGGLVFPFLKRAQLAAYGVSVAKRISGDPPSDDLHELTAFADNLIPHVLRMETAIRLSPELAAHVATGGEVASQSEEEIEIRAAAVLACEGLKARSLAEGRAVHAVEVASWLWGRGQQPRFKAERRHRTRTYDY